MLKYSTIDKNEVVTGVTNPIKDKPLVEVVKEKLKTRNLFITGGGGVGKSYLIGQLQKELPLVITSTTGISAVNIEGQTIHSWAGIGIADKPIAKVVDFILNDKRGKQKRRDIWAADYLVIDEISMLNSYTLDYINEVLKHVRQDNRPFGGIRVILVGDFFQLPPVHIGEEIEINRAKRLINYAFNSQTWKELDLETIQLTKVWRQTDKDFIDTLNNLRVGKITEKDIQLLETRNHCFDVPEEAVKIFAVNYQVDAENERRFNALPGDAVTFNAINQIRCYVGGKSLMLNPSDKRVPIYDLQKYESFDKDCRIPNELKIKVGCRVMLLKNIDFDRCLVNGSCGYVKSFSSDCITVDFDNGETYSVGREATEIKQGETVKISREQFPLRLAYSVSVHKSQGQTFDSCFIDCSNFFECGQGYVALSRARTLDKLYLRNFNPAKIFVDDRIKEFYNTL